MNWKIKSILQTLISKTPQNVSENLYYFIQKHFGDLKTVDPIERLLAGIIIDNLLRNLGESFEGKSFIEIGTGRRLNLPISLWILNADKVITVDLNEYLKQELIQKDLEYLSKNINRINEFYKDTNYDKKKIEELVLLSKSKWQLKDLFDLCNIEYIPNCDIRKLELKTTPVDYHISYTVLEHIPENVLIEIFRSANNVLKKDGIFIHFVDYRDHFWYSDKSISPINFLKYNEKMWNLIAGNKFMYMNRIRHDDFQKIFDDLFLEMLATKTSSENLLINDRILDVRFKDKSKDVLQTLDSWFVMKSKNN